jgi:hypothetical protein
VHDWEAVSLTVFLPVVNTNSEWFLAYIFKSEEPYDSLDTDVYYFARQGNRNFQIVDKRLIKWEIDGIHRAGGIP